GSCTRGVCIQLERCGPGCTVIRRTLVHHVGCVTTRSVLGVYVVDYSTRSHGGLSPAFKAPDRGEHDGKVAYGPHSGCREGGSKCGGSPGVPPIGGAEHY